MALVSRYRRFDAAGARSRSPGAWVLGAALALGAAEARAEEPLAAAPSTPAPEPGGVGYAGPLAAGLGAGVLGGGFAMVGMSERRGVTMGGSLVGAFGTGALMGGVAVWMLDGLSEEELEDKVRQGGVAFTVVGLGAISFGGLMVTSSFTDASDVREPGRIAGIIAASAGGASLLSGLIMYAVGGSPEAEESAVTLDAGLSDVMLTLRF